MEDKVGGRFGECMQQKDGGPIEHQRDGMGQNGGPLYQRVYAAASQMGGGFSFRQFAKHS